VREGYRVNQRAVRRSHAASIDPVDGCAIVRDLRRFSLGTDDALSRPGWLGGNPAEHVREAGCICCPRCEEPLATRVRQRNRYENVTDDTFSSLVCRLRHEFLGTPALALTPSNVARLWGLDRTTSECVLDFLAAHGYVQKTSNGAYTR
jgi:hypothetical protein